MFEPIKGATTVKYYSIIEIIPYRFGFMVFNATFNNIWVLSWRSVLFIEETGVPGKNHRPFPNHCQTWSHNVVSSTPRHERGSNSQLVVIGTDLHR